jgi:hypothetical protein
VTALVAAVATAATDDIQLLREYTNKVVAMQDTAAAHLELARWCEAHNLADRAKRHYEETLFRDPENKDARAALGYVKKSGSWVKVADSVPATSPGGTPGPTTVDGGPGPTTVDSTPTGGADRAKSLRQDILDISRQYLIPSDPEKWAQGRARLLAIRDPLAAEPIVKILGPGSVEVRCLEAEALGQIPGDSAMQPLVALVISDESPAVVEAAVKALAARHDPRAAVSLIHVVQRSQKPTLQRAAYALGEMGAWEATGALINNLKAIEARSMLVTEVVPEPPHAFFGTMTAYVANVEPVVAPGVVAYRPIIGGVTSGNGMGALGGSTGPTEQTVERMVPMWVEQPVILDALRKITGQDFGYNTATWRAWFPQADREHKIPPPPK